MKKKGLIISTVVMAVVLIASLTTATYAWFTTTNATTVESISIKAAAGADVKVGMAIKNSYNSEYTQDNFVSGSLTWDSSAADGADKWSGDPSMGFSLATGLTLASIDKATGYGTPYSTGTYTASASGTYYKLLDNSYTNIAPTSSTKPTYVLVETEDDPYEGAEVGDPIKYTFAGTAGTAAQFVPRTSTGKSIVKASGAGSVVDYASVDTASENSDYLHFVLGVSPSKTTIDTITITLFVNPGTNKTAIGVEAALDCYYSKNGAAFQGGEVYTKYTKSSTEYDIAYNTTKTNISSASTIGAYLNSKYSVSTYADSTVLNDGWKAIDITFGKANTPMTVDTIYQVEFYIFYDGTDSDCINSALGSECGILFSITNTVVA